MKYYIILTEQEKDTKLVKFLEERVGEEQVIEVIEGLGYSNLEQLNDLTLEDCSLSVQELEDGSYVCAANLANAIYLPNKCSFKGITAAQYDLAVLLAGDKDLLTTEEMRELNFKITE